MYKAVTMIAFSILLASCANTQSSAISKSEATKNYLVGIWAMRPLNNGIANVVEFTNDGKSTLHPFNCKNKTADKPDTSDYAISDDGRNILLSSNGNNQSLKIISKTTPKASKILVLEQTVTEDFTLKFSYVKMSKIIPLCGLFDNKTKKKSDFLEV